MIIYPAIDMRQGKCVRLLQGEALHETVYFADPVAVAVRWETLGASWLHLVDLDGAMDEGKQNRAIAAKIFRALKIPVQFGGGLRTMTDLDEIFEAGAARAILGTAAVEDDPFLLAALARFHDRIAVGIDAREGQVATKGWKKTESLDVFEFARKLASLGVSRVIYTDISRDGMLTGPNFEGTAQLADSSGLKLIASGGVGSLDDLHKIKGLEPRGIEGAIVGKALYEGRFTLPEALACAAGT
jgi:phosphoribosylformimino-5-aminoimidazole carboxamide ribotide isomerase